MTQSLERIIQLEDITLKDLEEGKVYKEIDDPNDEESILGLSEVNIKGIIPEYSGFYLISGKIKLADRTELHALFGVDTDSSGELCSTEILTQDGWTSQADNDFLERLKRTKEQVFPYKYHLNKPVYGDIDLEGQF